MHAQNQVTASPRLILDTRQVRQKITRIAYEIFERNFEEGELVVAGIVDRGYQLATMICRELDAISHFTFEKQTLQLIRVSLEKFTSKLGEIKIDAAAEQLEGKSIIVVDDVLNTGRTLAYSVQPFLGQNIKRMETAVLVNRSNIQFPVSASYTGYELATTLQEHIEVVLEQGKEAVYLK